MVGISTFTFNSRDHDVCVPFLGYRRPAFSFHFMTADAPLEGRSNPLFPSLLPPPLPMYRVPNFFSLRREAQGHSLISLFERDQV